MTNLEWGVLATKYYAFKHVAAKHNFFVPELNAMEKSLLDMEPFSPDEKTRKEILDTIGEE